MVGNLGKRLTSREDLLVTIKDDPVLAATLHSGICLFCFHYTSSFLACVLLTPCTVTGPCIRQNGVLTFCKNISANQINGVRGTDDRCLSVPT